MTHDRRNLHAVRMACADLANQPDLQSLADALLLTVHANFEVNRSAVLVVTEQAGQLQTFATYGFASSPEPIDVHSISDHASMSTALQTALAEGSRTQAHVEVISLHTTGVPAGFLYLEWRQLPEDLDSIALQLTASCAATRLRQLELEKCVDGLKVAVDYESGDSEFLATLMAAAMKALDVSVVILRTPERTRLRAISVVGTDDVASDALDVSVEDRLVKEDLRALQSGPLFHPPEGLDRWITGAVRWGDVISLRSGVTMALRDKSGEARLVATALSRIPDQFFRLDLTRIGLVESFLQQSVENHDLLATRATEVAARAQASEAITAQEIMQSLRHEARAAIDDCMGLIAIEKTRRKVDAISIESVSAIETVVKQLADLLDQMRSATRAPSRSRAVVPIRDVFEAARRQVAGRLTAERITVSHRGANHPLFISEDYIRVVFLNLLLNSLDAFQSGSARGNRREIGLLVDPVAPRDRTLRLRYYDTATGIQVHRLPERARESANPLEAIFEVGISGKENGGGHGLFIARRMMNDHQGSIRVLDGQDGMSFELTFPTSRLYGHPDYRGWD